MGLLLKNIWISDTFIGETWQIITVCKISPIQFQIVQVDRIILQILLIINVLIIMLYFWEKFL